MQGRLVLRESPIVLHIRRRAITSSGPHGFVPSFIQDRACQRAAWPEHKKFCKMNLDTHAFHESIPGSVERADALRAFIDKHRASMGAAAFQAVHRYYLPPFSPDPAATAQEREDMLVIDLRTRPNAQRARPEKRFYVVDAWLDTVSSFFSGPTAEAMRLKVRHGSELATASKGSPSGTVLITLTLSDPGGGPMPPNVVPFSFPVCGLEDFDVDCTRWKSRLFCMLNEGIVQ